MSRSWFAVHVRRGLWTVYPHSYSFKVLEIYHDSHFPHRYCHECFPVSQLYHLDLEMPPGQRQPQVPSSLSGPSFLFQISVQYFFLFFYYFITLRAFPDFQADFWKISCPVFWVLSGKFCLHYSICQNWKFNTKYDNIISSKRPLIISHKTQQ